MMNTTAGDKTTAIQSDPFKRQFAELAAAAFREHYPDAHNELGDKEIFDPDFIADHLEKPKDPTMGRFALPVFRYARLFKAKPPDIAATIADSVNSKVQSLPARERLISVSSVAGFINTAVDFQSQARTTVTACITEQRAYGNTDIGLKKKLLVEYSSVNIAKPFGIGHLRTTILGNSLRRVFTKLGYDVVGINYLGDWGTQFGKMIVAYREWGQDLDLSDNAVEKLYRLYVKYHEEAKNDPSLDNRAREAFKKLEDGDEATRTLWQRFRDLSWADFERVYKRLGIEFDLVTGEAFFNDKMDAVIERFEKANLTSESQGAEVVELDDPQLPPLLLRKSDGATLYATRDLAGLIWRWETYRFEESLYVVGAAQSDHFKQCFGAIAKLEDAEKLPETARMTGRVKHVDFGWVKFGDKAMASRAGTIIFLEDVVDKAVALAKDKIAEKNPDLRDPDDTAEMIGIGAVIYSQMSVRRQKDVNFVWDDVLNFEGETGPYLQYTHARLCSLLRNFGDDPNADIDFALLDQPEESRVIELLADFPQIIVEAARQYDPYMIAAHLIKLAAAYNKVYQRKDDTGKTDKIISDNKPLTRARMALVKAVQLVIAEGLYLLGIEAPNEM